ncbi:SDR family NAD(P)-dependent oxidoreductase [Roseivirga sp. E12]|uniref:SDR family NAD(P)-dependent oxidoreductase n=1 Tax=Roseivirga sp. E12 TaxID=2819237 RepID=UPI001ABCB559|nr:SDR family oxidoreductase [Roseivirga sp. E12]MBO3697702.1 SDR family oxidoreductase [Roseivirga sp. E12]
MIGKKILIVGASSGIGRSLAELLLKQGAEVISASRNNPNLSDVIHHNLDITEPSPDLSFIPEVLDGLVYCPGTINLRPFHRLSIEDFQADFDINLMGAIKVLQGAFKSLKKADSSSIILFSTVAAKLGMNFHSSIATSKGAIEGLGKSLAAEWSMHQIRVNVLSPSLTETPLAERLLANDDKKEASNKRHPIGRFGQPEDLAHTALLLLSDQSSWITGQIIGIDGGVGALKP